MLLIPFLFSLIFHLSCIWKIMIHSYFSTDSPMRLIRWKVAKGQVWKKKWLVFRCSFISLKLLNFMEQHSQENGDISGCFFIIWAFKWVFWEYLTLQYKQANRFSLVWTTMWRWTWAEEGNLFKQSWHVRLSCTYLYTQSTKSIFKDCWLLLLFCLFYYFFF